MAKTEVNPANGDVGNDAPKTLGATKPNTVLMPKSLAEIHTAADKVGTTEMIAAGTLLTPEVLDHHKLEDDTVDQMLRRGHAVLVEVYAGAVTESVA